MIQKPQRATLARMDTGEVIEFLANPHMLEDSKSAVYDEPEVDGAVAPPLKFKYGGARSIQFMCRFISQGNVDAVTKQVEFIRYLAIPVKPKNVPPLAFLTVGSFQMPIRIREWKVLYNNWTPALKPKDITVEVWATTDYGTPVPPPQPKPANANKAKAKQNSKKDLIKEVQSVTMR
ncbi:MAG: hypothetical protein PWR10_1776 [Halanaerobiales bacterium]|nr:hypothetical protein [Halanaerobiales bacterium]